MTLRVSKVAYCSRINWQELAEQCFPPQDEGWEHEYKVLIVREKLASNPHVHIQGESYLDADEFYKRFERICKVHYQFQIPGKRPVKHCRKEVNPRIYQYVCKEKPVMGDTILYVRGFTMEELNDLHEKSEAYLKELKTNLKRHLQEEVSSDDDVEVLHKKYKLSAWRFYREQDKMPPPNFQKLLLHHLGNREPISEAREIYASSRY